MKIYYLRYIVCCKLDEFDMDVTNICSELCRLHDMQIVKFKNKNSLFTFHY